MRRTNWLSPLAGLLLALECPGNLFAQGHKPPQRPVQLEYSSWMIYWGHAKSADALRRHQRDLEHVSLFAANLDPQLNLVPAAPSVSATLDQLKNAPPSELPPFYLTAVNDVPTPDGLRRKDPERVSAILNSPAATEKHINDLLKLSESLQGVEIDYENLPIKDRELFSAFIQELASRLYERDQKLIVLVQGKTYDSRTDGAGAIDWTEISKHADMVKVMAYNSRHEDGKPGPLAPPNWVIDISNFALTQIPPPKLCIALSMEGYDWPEKGEGRPISYDAAMRLAQAMDTKVKRDSQTQALKFTYQLSGRHEVWFEDAASIQRKIDVLKRIGVQHVALWWLGSGEDAVWSKLALARK